LRLPASLGRHLLHSARHLGGVLEPWPWWLVLGVLIGVGPVLVDYQVGLSGHRLVTGLLLAPLLLAAVSRDWQGRGMVVLGLAFAAHSAVTIYLAARDPAGLALVCPGGADYWERSRAWIMTGVSEEYDLGWWLPAHFQLLGVMFLGTYSSLGLIPLWQGFYEVDLMNYYVGQLLAQAHTPGWELALAWHPWSLCRGVGYLFLTYEIASLSLARLTGTPLSSAGRRCRRWGIGLGFLVLDGVLKYVCLEPIRQILSGYLA
jgi:hypothetical protein